MDGVGDLFGTVFLNKVLARQQDRVIESGRQLRSKPYAAQIVWGVRDPLLTWRRYGVQAQLAAGLDDATLLPGKHFVQEDCPEDVADAVQRLATATR